MAVGDAHVFPGFLTPVLTQLFFPKPPTIFLTCFCRGEWRKYVGKKVHLNRGSNSQPGGCESDKLTTEPPGRGDRFGGGSVLVWGGITYSVTLTACPVVSQRALHKMVDT